MRITNSPQKRPPSPRPDVLASVTGSEARADILDTLFTREARPWAVSELSRASGRRHQNVQTELRRLEAAGLVRVMHIDGRRHYQPETEDPIARDLARFVHQTRGRVPDIRRILEAERAPSLAWILRDDRETAPRWVLVVLSAMPKRLVEARIVVLADRHLVLHPMSIGEWVTRLRKGETFVRRARRAPKLWVIGSGHELIRWEQRWEAARSNIAQAVRGWREELSDEWDEDWDPSEHGRVAL